jgi:1-acyl-sn-glycerol-3-phosphate acyltransferase
MSQNPKLAAAAADAEVGQSDPLIHVPPRHAYAQLARRARSSAFLASFYGWTGVVAIGLLPVALFSYAGAVMVAHLWARGALWLLWRTTGVTHVIKGVENLPSGAAIVALKHQSVWDTIALWVLLERPAIVLKDSLLKIPVVNVHFKRVGAIAIDRSQGAKSLRLLLRSAREAILLDRAIAIFPEGTRSAVGQPPTFQPGVAALYASLKVPVIPVALNSGLFWPPRGGINGPGTILVEVLPPIQPGLDKRDFLVRLEQDIETASVRLLQATAGKPLKRERR